MTDRQRHWKLFLSLQQALYTEASLVWNFAGSFSSRTDIFAPRVSYDQSPIINLLKISKGLSVSIGSLQNWWCWTWWMVLSISFPIMFTQ